MRNQFKHVLGYPKVLSGSKGWSRGARICLILSTPSKIRLMPSTEPQTLCTLSLPLTVYKMLARPFSLPITSAVHTLVTPATRLTSQRRFSVSARSNASLVLAEVQGGELNSSTLHTVTAALQLGLSNPLGSRADLQTRMLIFLWLGMMVLPLQRPRSKVRNAFLLWADVRRSQSDQS